MPNATISPRADHVLDLNLREIHYRARRLGYRFRLSPEDFEDVQQELARAVLRAMRRYNSDYACRRTFINSILDRHCRHVARQLATVRRHKALPPGAPLPEVTNPLRIDIAGDGGRTEAEKIDVRVDIETVLGGLSEQARRVGECLMTYSPTEVAERCGIHRSTVYRFMRLIRCRMIELGVTSYS